MAQPAPDAAPANATDWRAQELLLMREVMRLLGKSLAPGLVLREMLHLMSELLGLNRGPRLRQFSYRLRRAGVR